MKKFSNFFLIIIYYIAWMTGIILAAHGLPWISTLFVMILICVQMSLLCYLNKDNKKLVCSISLLTFIGTCVDSILLYLGFIIFNANPFSPYLCPPWIIALWLSFAVTIYSILLKLFDHLFLLAILSFLGFSFAYAVGVKMGAAFFPKGYNTALLIGFIWMILLPGSYMFLKKIKKMLC